MDAKEIRKAVEGYSGLIESRSKLHKRMIRLSGKDLEMGIFNMQRIQEIDRKIELIDYAIFESDILTDRERVVLEWRSRGETFEEIAKIFLVGRERIRQILDDIYRKLAEGYKETA